MLLLEAWRLKCFLFGLLLGLLCWRLSLWHLIEVDGLSGLDISSSIGLCFILFSIAFILDKDLAYLEYLD